MFTDHQLEVLMGMLQRRQDPNVPAQDYEDMLRLTVSEQESRRTARRKNEAARARRAAVESPTEIPGLANDPIKW